MHVRFHAQLASQHTKVAFLQRRKNSGAFEYRRSQLAVQLFKYAYIKDHLLLQLKHFSSHWADHQLHAVFLIRTCARRTRRRKHRSAGQVASQRPIVAICNCGSKENFGLWIRQRILWPLLGNLFAMTLRIEEIRYDRDRLSHRQATKTDGCLVASRHLGFARANAA